MCCKFIQEGFVVGIHTHMNFKILFVVQLHNSMPHIVLLILISPVHSKALE